MSRRLTFVLCFALLALAGPAFGQAGNQQAQAKQHFDVAEKAYKGGDYPKAVQEYLTAYQLAPLNGLLFNIGQSYRMAGDKEKALAYYEKYVEFEPAGGQVTDAKQYIQDLKVDVETAKKERESQEADAQAKAEAEAKAKAAADAKAKAAADARARAQAEDAGSGLRTGGYIVGGAGVAAVAVGIAVAAGGSSGAGIGIAAGGAALIGGGIAMYIVGNNQKKDAMAKAGLASFVAPSVAPGFVGVAWGGSF